MGNFHLRLAINLLRQPAHLKEATYFLSKGLPTTYMSDSKREVPHKDPKKTLPKRYEKALKY